MFTKNGCLVCVFLVILVSTFSCLTSLAEDNYALPVPSYEQWCDVCYTGPADGYHKGVDLINYIDTPFFSIADNGEVEVFYSAIGGYGGWTEPGVPTIPGQMLLVKYPKGGGHYFYVQYGHIKDVPDWFKAGNPQPIKNLGTFLGKIANYDPCAGGSAACPHMHFGIWDDDAPPPTNHYGYGTNLEHWVDPLKFIAAHNTSVEFNRNGGAINYGLVDGDIHWWHEDCDLDDPDVIPACYWPEDNTAKCCFIQDYVGDGSYGDCAVVFDALGGARRSYTVRGWMWDNPNDCGWSELVRENGQSGQRGPQGPLGMPITNEYPTVAGGVRQDFQKGYIVAENNQANWYLYSNLGLRCPGWSESGYKTGSNSGWNNQYSYLFALAYERNGGATAVGLPSEPVRPHPGNPQGTEYVYQPLQGGTNGEGAIFYDPDNGNGNSLATNEAYYIYGPFWSKYKSPVIENDPSSAKGPEGYGCPTRDVYMSRDPEDWNTETTYPLQNFMKGHGDYADQHYMILKPDGVKWHSSYVTTYFSQAPSGPIDMRQGESGTFTLSFRNTGTVTWYNDPENHLGDYVELKSCDASGLKTASFLNYPYDASLGWLNYESPCTMNEAIVSPGEIATFTFTGRVPSDASLGQHLVYFRPNHSTGGLMENWGGAHFVINVTSAPSSGYVSVSDGVSVSSDPILLGQTFTVSFSLTETTGRPITFEQVGVAILHADGSELFDLAMYNQVSFAANETRSFAPTGQIYDTNPPGTYKAVVRGRVAGGNWFDFSTTGSGVNPLSFAVETSLVVGGNYNPRLYLEIYEFESDPDDPGPAPSYLRGHASPEQMSCYAAKERYHYACVPIHVDNLSYPIAKGWPATYGPGGGFVGVECGVASSGVACTYVGFTPCPGWLQGPGTAPGSIVVAAFDKCHDWNDHPGYLKYVSTSSNLGASYFDIVDNADEGGARVINCQAALDMNTEVSGRAQWGGTQTIACAMAGTEPLAVTEGVHVTPNTVYDCCTDSMTVSFSLKETGGVAVTCRIDVAIFAEPGSPHYVQNFVTYHNVSFAPYETKSFSHTGPAVATLDPPWVAVGRGASGNWVDFTTSDNGVNPRGYYSYICHSTFVSGGVSVSPTPVILNHDFTVNFTLCHLGGASGGGITYEKVAVAVLRADSSHVFDMATYSNVSFFEGSRTFSANGQIPSDNGNNSPGTYKAVIRGKVPGCDWFDFGVYCCGGSCGVNPLTFAVVSGPVGLTFSSVTASGDNGYVTLSWQAEADVPASSFVVRRAESSSGVYTAVNVPVVREAELLFSCADQTVLPGRTYWYEIVLMNSSGEEASGPIEVYVKPVPVSYAAHESYPNPFNPMCTIRYEIPKPGCVSLRVYDIVGKPVRVLVDGWREIGVYSEVWNGKADDGSALPSGVYFYSIKAGDFVATRKMVLLR
jgi:hypothetical protein